MADRTGLSRRDLLLGAGKNRGKPTATTTPKPTKEPKPTTSPKPTKTGKPTSTPTSTSTATSTATPTATATSSPTATTTTAPPPPAPGVLDVYVNDGYLPMVDGSLVYHRGYGDRPTATGDSRPSLTLPPTVFTRDGRVVASRTYPLDAALPTKGRPTPAGPDPDHFGQFLVRRRHWASFLPERTLVAETGSTIRIRLHNGLAQPHELAVLAAGPDGYPVSTGLVDPGRTGELELAAPAPGTYVFADRQNAPVERTLGLFGVLVVVPADNPWTPYPGGPEFERQWVWICHDVETTWAAAAANGRTVDPAATPALPRYFTLNGRSGFQSLGLTRDTALNLTREEDTLISGFPRQVDVRDFGRTADGSTAVLGQLVRLVNPGIVKHQMHFHGNHVWTVWRNGQLYPRRGGYVDAAGHVVLQQWEDTVELNALDRKDSVIPVKRPPDATDRVWRSRTTSWRYPMHCHAEPSQTAAGGMYPGGLVADWTLAAAEEGQP